MGAAQYRLPTLFFRLFFRLLERGTVAVFGKDLIAVVTAVEAVEHNATWGSSRASWHASSLAEPHPWTQTMKAIPFCVTRN